MIADALIEIDPANPSEKFKYNYKNHDLKIEKS